VEIRVERGAPTDEELAALVGALLTLRSALAKPAAAVNRWVLSGRPRRDPGPRGKAAWRTSALPR
jgi:acyl-CoA carboxylase epsilon subunit-like protein